MADVTGPGDGLQGNCFVVLGSGNLGEGAVDDLVDGIDGFTFTGTAAKYEDAGYEMKLRIVSLLQTVHFIFFLADNAGNANWFATMAAKNTAEMLTDGFC